MTSRLSRTLTLQSTGVQSVVVDPATLFQAFREFGGTFKDWTDADVAPANVVIDATAQGQILDALGEAGISGMLADTYDGGTLPYTNDKNQSKDVEQIALLAQMIARGWRVTGWGKPIGTGLSHTDPTDFCTQTLSRIDYWYSQGVPLPFWGVKNEPAISSPAILGAYLRDAIKNMGPVLAGRGQGATKFIVSTDTNPTQALTACNVIAADGTAMQYVAAFSTHLYGGSPSTVPNYGGSAMASLRDLAASKGVEFWMDEWVIDDWAIFAQTIHDLLNTYNCQAIYNYLPFGSSNLVATKGHQGSLIRVDTSGSSGSFAYAGFTKLPIFYVMRQWSKFVAPGMQRCAVTVTGVNATAFVDGSHVTVVLWNSGSARDVQLSGVTGVFVDGARTSATESGVAVSGAPVYHLPAASLTTLRFTA